MRARRRGSPACAPGMWAPGREPQAGSDAGFGIVEVLIAVVILAFGLLALAGVSLSTAGQTRGAAYDTDHAMAAQEILDAMAQSYAGVATGTSDTTVAVAGRSYTVSKTVTQSAARLKDVQLVVSGPVGVKPDTFVTRLNEPGTLPGDTL